MSLAIGSRGALDFVSSRQAENTLEECWPLNPLGPLPALLSDRQHLDEAFFKSFPTLWKVSGSAVRRSLKHTAKKLGFSHGRFSNNTSQDARDEALAFKLASLPAGRDALPSVEILIEDVRRHGRNGQLTWRFGRGLPEILWSRYLTDSKHDELVSWIDAICVDRTDNAGGKRSYLTADALQRALSNEGIPAGINEVDLARAILIFAGLLKQQEAGELIHVARSLGIASLGSAPAHDLPASDRHSIDVGSDRNEVERDQLSLPKLGEGSPYMAFAADAPQPTSEASSILRELEEKFAAAERTFEAAADLQLIDPGTLVAMGEHDFNIALSTIQDARLAKLEREAADQKAKGFVRHQLQAASARAGVPIPDEARYLRAEGAELSNAVLMADAISQFAAQEVDDFVREIWDPSPGEFHNLTGIQKSFAQLPVARQYIEDRSVRETAFIEQVRVFVSDKHSDNRRVASWITSLSETELRLLCKEVDPTEWPVLSAILGRLNLDANPSFVDAFCRGVCAVADLQRRRDLMYFVDPSAVIFDKSPDLQRVIAAEKFQDIISFGPIEAVSDPSLRLHSIDLVGSITSDIANLLVQHLDLFSNGAELREVASSGSDVASGARKNEAASDLLSFAMTPSTSAGYYLMLREAVRERHFLPLIRDGVIDIKAALAAAAEFDVDAAIERAVSDIRKSSHRAARIEARHRARVSSYVQTGKELLDAFVRSHKAIKSPRANAFGLELRRLLGLLNEEDAPIGSHEWLESRVKQTILGLEQAPDLPTLQGDAKSLASRVWSPADTAWAQQSIDLADFYSVKRLSVADVAAGTLRQWGQGRPLSTLEIFEGLLERRLYGEALSYVEEAFPDGDARNLLHGRAVKIAVAATAPTARRFRDLKEATAPEIFEALPGASAVNDALERYDVTAATEQLDLLELEIQDAVESQKLDALDASRAGEKTLLLTRLLQAGIEGPDEKWPLLDLQKKWAETLNAQSVQRTHLKAVEKALDSHGALPELSEDVERFAEQALDPATWLPQERAHDLSEFLDGAADKLRTWGQLASQLSDPKQRTALVEVIQWFVSFVLEQTSALRALDLAEPTDNLLERVLEVTETIEQAPDPLVCASNLGFLGEAVQEPVAQPERSLSSALAANATILPLIEKGDWTTLAQTARKLRTSLNDEDGRRMAETAEFAETLSVVTEGNPRAARDGIQIAAKVLTTHGSVVNRALNQAQQLQIAYQLLVTSMMAGDDASGISTRLPSDRSWGAIASRKAQFYQVFTGTGLASRTLEQLCSGALGREIVNRLWDAPTSTSEPGPFRAMLLSFLHEKGLSEHLLSLAQRHEPAIRPRLEQLLNLRSIALHRPDLVPVSEAFAEQIVKAAQGVPFRTFVSGLPTAAKAIDADLIVTVDNDIILRVDRQKNAGLSMAVSIEPRGLVPEYIEAVLFPDDDVSFEDGTRRAKISAAPLYFANQFTVAVRFGPSWIEGAHQKADNFRIRISARVLAGELINRDVVCQLTRANNRHRSELRLDNDTLLEAYPGVESTPASGDSFFGRHDELETLHNALIGARRPSPVLLTGMRRIGKTSLLYAFHDLHRHPERDAPVTVYFSLAERRGAMMDPGQTVGSVFFAAITQALGKRHFSAHDPNRELGEKLKQRFGGDRDAVRNAILELREPESVADTLTILSEKLLEWLGSGQRIVYLVDEAETLVLPYKGGDVKRLELEQLLQGIREVSQTSTRVGLLLCGSNHIDEFTQSYKEAFFGSSVLIRLSGITATETAKRLIAPDKLAPYMNFGGELVRYAIELCAGMPQFLWQLGAATSAIVRSGPVSKADVRQGLAVLVGERSIELPFKTYEVLEPIEHMLGLQGQREQDLYWLLLYRVANSSSLVVDEAQQSFIIDQSLLELDEFEGWKQRLISLCNLSILEMTRPAMYRFKVPIFAEGFRALRQQQKYLIRHQRAGT